MGLAVMWASSCGFCGGVLPVKRLNGGWRGCGDLSTHRQKHKSPSTYVTHDCSNRLTLYTTQTRHILLSKSSVHENNIWSVAIKKQQNTNVKKTVNRRVKVLSQSEVTDRWGFSFSCPLSLVHAWPSVSSSPRALAHNSVYTPASGPSQQTYPWETNRQQQWDVVYSHIHYVFIFSLRVNVQLSWRTHLRVSLEWHVEHEKQLTHQALFNADTTETQESFFIFWSTEPHG